MGSPAAARGRFAAEPLPHDLADAHARHAHRLRKPVYDTRFEDSPLRVRSFGDFRRRVAERLP